MIGRRELARALGGSSASDWIVVERRAEIATIDRARNLTRLEHRTRTHVVAHQDGPSGRGTVQLDVAADDDANRLVLEALRLASGAVGPAWRSPPPAAPAKVQVFDEALAGRDLVEAARRATELRRVPGITTQVRLELVRERVELQSRARQEARWDASHVRAELLVTTGERSLRVVREARRLADLELEAAVLAAANDLGKLASAQAPTPGRYAVILGPDAMLHGEGAGVWDIFATQADAVLERQGLTRYRLGAPIAPGATAAAPPLTIQSDGALDHGLRSAPVGEDGDAVRRFTLVERGIAVGLGLTAREAALRGKDPNGGVRNLVVAPGTWDGARPAAPTIELRRLRALAVDMYTGDASLEVALGIRRMPDGTTQPFAGGTVRLDLVAALATARRSTGTVRRGAYRGPESVLIDEAELSA